MVLLAGVLSALAAAIGAAGSPVTKQQQQEQQQLCTHALAGCWPVKADHEKCEQCEARQAKHLHAVGCTAADLQAYCGGSSFIVESVAVLGSSPKPRADTSTVSFPATSASDAMALSWANGSTLESVDGGRTWHQDPGGVRFVPGNGHGVRVGNTVRSVDGAGVPNGYTSCAQAPGALGPSCATPTGGCPPTAPTCVGGLCFNTIICDPRRKLSPPLSGPFTTNYSLIATANPDPGSQQRWNFSVDRTSAGQTSWGPPPHPVVLFSPGSGGVVALGAGRFVATVWVWYSEVPLQMPNEHGPCCNGSVVAYLSTDLGHTFTYRSEVANKQTISDGGWPSLEGPNENDIVLLKDGKTLLCVIRKDGGDGQWPVHTGKHGPHVPFLFATSIDMEHWSLREAPPTMLSARPRALVLPGSGAIVVAGGRPGLNFWVSADGKGDNWEKADIPTLHNQKVHDPQYRFCSQFENATLALDWAESSCYTQVVQLSGEVAMICYERQGYNPGSGWKHAPAECAPNFSTIFCMRVRIPSPVVP